MPWQEMSIMDQRVEFVMLAQLPGTNMSELCRRAGISRQTGYKWVRRFGQDADTAALLGRLDDETALPIAAASGGELVPVAVPARFAAKIALIEAFRAAHARDPSINQSELARRLGVDHKEIRRRLDPDHKTKLPALEETLKALGKRLVVSVEDAA